MKNNKKKLQKNYTKEQYQDYVTEKAPKSKKLMNFIKAFVSGGFICFIAQLILNFYLAKGLDKQTAASTLSVTMIFLGGLLTGLGIYDKIAKFAGAGSLVPITGFANAIVSPAMDSKHEGFILGLGSKMFIIAGPVIVFGTIFSAVLGLIVYLF